MENGYCAVLNDEKTECVRAYHYGRISNAIKMIDESPAMRLFFPWPRMFELAAEIHSGK